MHFNKERKNMNFTQGELKIIQASVNHLLETILLKTKDGTLKEWIDDNEDEIVEMLLLRRKLAEINHGVEISNAAISEMIGLTVDINIRKRSSAKTGYVLEILNKENKPIALRELAKKAGKYPWIVNQHVRQLENEGLVIISQDNYYNAPLFVEINRKAVAS